MRLTDKYRPRRLSEVVGQAAARVLERFCRRPYRSCWLLEGPPGTGKSASAHAVAEELRCTTLSKHPIPVNKLNVELAQGLFDAWTRFLPMDGAAFHVVIIEEFERVVSQEVKGYLKTALDWSVDADAGLPAPCVVVATSNNVEKIEPALLERFEVLQFSGGTSFAELAQEQQCRRFWERQLKPIGVTWASFMADEAVSAFKKPLFRRPQGQLLLLNLHSGDHLIITRFDRVFRSMEDFITAYKLLQTWGVMIHTRRLPVCCAGRLRKCAGGNCSLPLAGYNGLHVYPHKAGYIRCTRSPEFSPPSSKATARLPNSSCRWSTTNCAAWLPRG